MSTTKTYEFPLYAPDGDHGIYLTETSDNGTVIHGWMHHAASGTIYRTLDRGPYVPVGRGDLFSVAESLGYDRA